MRCIIKEYSRRFGILENILHFINYFHTRIRCLKYDIPRVSERLSATLCGIINVSDENDS